jgi:hypothetical protein
VTQEADNEQRGDQCHAANEDPLVRRFHGCARGPAGGVEALARFVPSPESVDGD